MAAIRSSLLILALLLAGGEARSAAPPKDRAAACTERTFEGARFTACRYDSRRDELLLALDDGRTPLRSFERLKRWLGPRAGRLLFAMNAGMFEISGAPVGLYVENGTEKHRINRRSGFGNFHMLPNGVFAVDERGTVAVVPSEEWPPSGFRTRWATQSGPMLVIDGRLHPQIQPNGTSLYVRNGVGVADPHNAWFVISDEPVSFGRLARFFRDALGCRNALYFDGSVASLWEPDAGREDAASQLGPLVAVMGRR